MLFSKPLCYGYSKKSSRLAAVWPDCGVLLLALIGLFFCHFQALGQSTLKGRVQLPDSSAATMAVVKLLAPDSATLLSYTRTNLQGEWIQGKVKPGDYVLQVAFLGLETWARRITVSGTDTLVFDIRLQELPLTLRVVEISANRIGIVERGDTLQYDLSYYLDSTEHNLKDLLNKLPDMRVEGDGSIQYKGKRVNIALVEGRDLFGHMHKAMTEGIAAENVKGVQIVRAYKTGAEQEAQELSDKIAVNVQLTDEARRKLNGDAGFDTDAHRFVEGYATLYQSRPKWGYSLIARGNNTAQSTISGADILALMDFEDGAGKQGMQEGVAELISPLLVPRPDAQSSRDILAAANFDASWNTRWNSNLNVRYIQADRSVNNVLFRLYLQEGAEFTGMRSGRYDANMWQANLKNDYRGNGMWIKQRLLVNTNRAPVTVNTNGVLAGRPFENRFSHDASLLHWKGFLESGIGVDSQRMLIGRITYTLNHKSDPVGLQSPFTLLGTQDSLLQQRNDLREASLTGEVLLRQPVNAHQMTVTAGYSHSAFRVEADIFPVPSAERWSLDGKMQDAGFYGAIAMGCQGKSRYRASAKATALYRTFPAEPAKQYRYLLADIQGGYYRDFAPTHSLYVNAGYSTSPTPFVHLWRYNRIRDENSVYVEQLDSSFLQHEAFANLFYSRISPGNNYSLFLTQTASFKKNEVLYQAIPNGNYLLYQSLLAPSVTQFSTTARIGYRFKSTAISANATVRYNFKTGFALLSEQLVKVRNQDANATFSLNYHGWKRFDFSVNHTIISNIQRYEGQDAFRFSDNRSGASASCRHKSWQAYVSASYRYQQFSPTPNQFWALDFEVERRFSKPSIRVRLTGRNVLNLKGNAMIMPDFGANYTGFSSFQTIGGQILAGVGWVF